MADSFSPGNIIRGRYAIQGLIGQGGMGAVYCVADRRLPGRFCALKVMWAQPTRLPGVGDSDAARQQFLAEASTLGRLDHPNLPKVSDYFSLDEYDCLVMDYVPGPDLNRRIAEARRLNRFLPLAEILAWMQQLCDVLAYLHGQEPPIIHGDVKPANVKLTDDGRVKLVDFGLVRPGAADDPHTLTGAGLRGLGSLPYAALEQYAGSPSSTDPRSDLYSLGATLYHLVTNRVPEGAHDRFLDPDVLIPPRQINPDLTPAIERAILAAMQPHPNDRPRSVAAWQARLAGVHASTSRDADPESATLGEARVWAQIRWFVVAATLLILAAALLTFLR